MVVPERHSRLIEEPPQFDFFERLAILKRFESGESLPSPLPIPASPMEARPSDYASSCRFYEQALIASHLGIDVRANPLADAKRVVELATEIFCGEWWRHYRQSPKYDKFPTPAHEIRSRFLESWVMDYCYGVLCALILDDEIAAGRLGCYPGPDLRTDEAERGLVRADMIFHVILGSYLRYGDMQEVSRDWIGAVRKGPSVRAKLWFDALTALDKRKAKEFAEAFIEVARHYRQHEYSRTLRSRCMCLVMLEGGILWHLARKKGIEPKWADLPQDVSDHLMTVETLTRRE